MTNLNTRYLCKSTPHLRKCPYISSVRSVCELCWLLRDWEATNPNSREASWSSAVDGRCSFPVSTSLPWKGTHDPRPHPVILNSGVQSQSGQCSACPVSTPGSGNSAKIQAGAPQHRVLPPAPLLIFTNTPISQEGFEESWTAVPKGSPWDRIVWDCTTQSLPQMAPKRALYWLFV